MKRFCFCLLLFLLSFIKGFGQYTVKEKAAGFGLSFLSGAIDGLNQMINYHYSDFQKICPNCNPEKWNPKISWKRKWKIDATGKLIYPLEERFSGSSTVFVLFTDMNHTTRSLNRLTGTAGVVMVIKPWKQYNKKGKYNIKHLIFDIIIYSISKSIGFNLIFKALPKLF